MYESTDPKATFEFVMDLCGKGCMYRTAPDI